MLGRRDVRFGQLEIQVGLPGVEHCHILPPAARTSSGVATQGIITVSRGAALPPGVCEQDCTHCQSNTERGSRKGDGEGKDVISYVIFRCPSACDKLYLADAGVSC